MTDFTIAFQKTETGKVEAVTMSAIDATHATAFFPHEWSLEPDKFAAPDDAVAALADSLHGKARGWG